MPPATKRCLRDDSPRAMTPTLADYRTAQAATQSTPEGPARVAARQAAQRLRRTIYEDCARQTLTRRLDPARNADDEAMLWFWFNHFNVYWRKDLVGAALPSYLDGAIRPHLHGRFRDLLLVTLTHPAMLVYLDNSRNFKNRLNENLAREVLELHTLGVEGGYTQNDVQETARILTGFGLRPLKPVRWPKRIASQVREDGEFLFDPRRHDFGKKKVLGQSIDGQGYPEIETLADMLAQHPATAHHLARKLCLYRLGDFVPKAVEEAVARAYLESGGRLDPTIAAINAARDGGTVPTGRTFKDPMKWLLGGVLLLADGHAVTDAVPLVRWLRLLGQPLFDRTTPDGYSLRGSEWLSAGQLAQRFELARAIVGALPRLLGTEPDLDVIWKGPGVRAIEGRLSDASWASIEGSESAAERLALVLASPEFMYV